MNRRENIAKIERVLMKAYAVMSALEEKALKDSAYSDLSGTEVRTLNTIDIGTHKSMGEISGELQISISTLTVAVNKLVRKGYVRKLKCDKDKRIVRVVLTGKGCEVVTAYKKFRLYVTSKMLLKYPTKDVEELAEKLGELDSYLDVQREKYLKE